MPTNENCPICTMPEPLIAADGFECATCGHEWLGEPINELDDIRDANGNLLSSGDDVTIIKDLKLNGKSGGAKVGTKAKSIRLVPGDHEVEAKIDGRTILIKAAFVKRA